MGLFHWFAKANEPVLLLGAIFVVSLLLRLWLFDKRWINPDEGAHLMDAVLALDGKIPQVDFSVVSLDSVYGRTTQ